jgi:CO dehydrogenase nickel-insertion accessory protein CooC1
MPSKRNEMESAAEQSLSPKKKPSQTLENGNKLKRKLENDNDLQNIIAKSPKKAVVAATRTSRRIKDLELVEEVLYVLPKMKRGSEKYTSIVVELVDEVVPVVAPKGKRVSKKLAPIEG